MKVLQGHKSNAPDQFFASLKTHLSALPQFCVDEAAATRGVRLLAWGLVIALAATAHTSITSFLHSTVAAKREY